MGLRDLSRRFWEPPDIVQQAASQAKATKAALKGAQTTNREATRALKTMLADYRQLDEVLRRAKR